MHLHTKCIDIYTRVCVCVCMSVYVYKYKSTYKHMRLFNAVAARSFYYSVFVMSV